MSNINISNIINVTLSETTIGLSSANMNALALFSHEQPKASMPHGYHVYNTASDIAEDFGTTSETYKQGVAIFSGSPNILSSGGYLVVIPLLHQSYPATKAMLKSANSVTNNTLSAITAGSYTFIINEISYSVTLGASPSANDIVSALTGVSAFSAKYTISVTTNSQDQSSIYTLTTKATGSSAIITIGTASNRDKDLALLLNLSGSANGEKALTIESISRAIIRTQSKIFYLGMITTQTLPTIDAFNLSSAVQGLDKILFLSSYNSNTLDEQTGMFWKIQQSGNTHTRCLLYVGANPSNATLSLLNARVMAAAYASLALSTNFSGSNTTSTMQLKSLKTILPDAGLTQNLITETKKIGVDVYPGFGGISGLLTSGLNHFFDDVYNGLWFKLSLQVAGFNYLKQTNSKIPQTNSGMTGFKNAFTEVCRQGIINAYLAPGTWNSPDTFGNPELFKKNINQYGYYIWSLPLSSQNAKDRMERKAPLVQIAVKLAGAIHSVNVLVNINQ